MARHYEETRRQAAPSSRRAAVNLGIAVDVGAQGPALSLLVPVHQGRGRLDFAASTPTTRS